MCAFAVIVCAVCAIDVHNATALGGAFVKQTMSACYDLKAMYKQCSLMTAVEQQNVSNSIANAIEECSLEENCVAVSYDDTASNPERWLCSYRSTSNATSNSSASSTTSETCWTKSVLLKANQNKDTQTENSMKEEENLNCSFFHADFIGCDGVKYAGVGFLSFLLIAILFVFVQNYKKNKQSESNSCLENRYSHKPIVL